MTTATLIRIDRSTFRKNPRAGSLVELVRRGADEATVIVTDERGRYRFVGYGMFNSASRSVTGRFVCTDAEWPGGNDPLFLPGHEVERKFEAGDSVSIDVHSGIVAYHRRTPAPNWLGEYEPTPVTCRECGATFPHTELDSDETADVYVEDTCPKCYEPRCCDYEFEKPEDVAREMGLTQ